jgi:hypothetical protein
MFKESPFDRVKAMMEHENLTLDDCKKAHEQLKQEQLEREKQKKQVAEKHRLEIIERNKPENAVPYFAPSMHVPQNRADAEQWALTTPLKPLEKYVAELSCGIHVQDFKGASVLPMITFLKAIIARREENGNKELINTMQETRKTLTETRNDLKTIRERLNPDPDRKTRGYTT